FHLADLYMPMVTLENDRTGVAFVGALRDGREPVDMLAVDYFMVIQHYCDIAANEADVVTLPFARALAGIHGGEDSAVERTIAMRVRRPAEVVQDLDLVAAAQTDPA